MKISVIIPVYNAARFLTEAVESVLRQPEVAEIILIEDESPDDAINVCRKLERQFEKVKVYQHPDKKNHGAASSRNLGIRNASYEWIAFLDADDVYLENRFKHIPGLVRSEDSIDGVYDAVDFMFEDEKRKRGWTKGELTTIKKILDPDELFYYLLMGKGHFHLDGLTVKKELLLNAGLFDKRLRLHQDTDLCAKIAALGKLVGGIIDAPVARQRIHSKNRYFGPETDYKITAVKLYRYLFHWTRDRENLNKKYLKLLLTHYLYIDSLKQASVQEEKIYKNLFRIISKLYRISVLMIGMLFRYKF